MNHIYSEIDEVIKYIHNNIDGPLSLSHLADYARYSPYHFSRIFKQRTGLSPHHYVSSLKLQRAKDLLLNTELTIRDIGMEIGQQSLGTFTTRFTERVGISPSQFRKSPSHINKYLKSLKTHTNLSHQSIMAAHTNIVEGSIEAEIPFHGVILAGLFTKPIPAGLPQYGTILTSLGDFIFPHVRPGIYYLMVTAVTWEMKSNEILVPNQNLRAKASTPIIVNSKIKIPKQNITLREPRLDDPPILISLPLLMKNFLNRKH
ncbi:helix-turn-helix domain-containing protein [Evansella clarkii]|uniref:helix-turn-helix domain-containing protein n=1 Tax=Evansella clarkii TaxID=79879 RepID=UPI000B43319C|nr:AraC family transcriptional regulator [Evansella clarkii]